MMPDQEAQPPFLTFARFRLYLRIQSLMVLPPYKGAVFRGAFGSSLRRLVCMTRQSDCQACLLRDRCLYVVLFEPPPPPGYLEPKKFRQAPRGYVLNPPLTSRQSFHNGDILEFDLALIGHALEALPYFIHIFIEMGRQGLGRERGRYELMRVDVRQNGAFLPIYEASSRTLTAFVPESGPLSLPGDDRINSVALQFLTPLRLKVKGDLVTGLSFPLLFTSLARRLALLMAFYGGNGSGSPAGSNYRCNPISPEADLLPAQAAEIQVAKTGLHWFDWERYSRRQDAAMKFGGLVGPITFSGEMGPFLPYLRLGEIVNVGQATTFGLGKYRLI